MHEVLRRRRKRQWFAEFFVWMYVGIIVNQCAIRPSIQSGSYHLILAGLLT
jgi:hypothetical protein